MRKISIAIVGAGHKAMSLYNCFKHKKNVAIVGIADVYGEGSDFEEAREKGIIVSKAMDEIISVDGLDVIADTTGDPEILKSINGLKKDCVRVVDSSTLELMITLINHHNLYEAKFLSLLSNVNEGVLIVDKDGNITYMNDEFLKITGSPEEEILGCNVHEKCADSPVSRSVKLREPLTGRHSFFDRPDEEYNFTITPVFVGEQFKGVVGIFKKIPEIAKLTKELERSSTIIEEISNKINYIGGIPSVDDSDIIPIDRMEHILLRQALTKFGYSVEGKKMAAKALNISLATLYNKLKKYQLS